MRLSRRPEPFDSEEFLYELKIDGFRALAYIENGQCDLVSRNGNTFHNFKALAQRIGQNLRVDNAVLDGEIACVDDSGRSVFNDLLFRRRECVFFAFDLLFLNGEDLRALPLIERKARLKRLLRRKRSPVLYVDHIEAHGRQFFDKACELDLEGIVAKRQTSAYRATEKASLNWIKIKNPSYSQAEGRDELFTIRSLTESLKFDHSEINLQSVRQLSTTGLSRNSHLSETPGRPPAVKPLDDI